MENSETIRQRLIDPFEETDLEWKPQHMGTSTKGVPWVLVVPYITARAVQDRLDDVFGYDAWQNVFKETADKKGYLCGISFIGCKGEWITKWDGSEYSAYDPLKGALSGAMKRSSVVIGIGRYLYNFKSTFAITEFCESRYEAVEPWVYAHIKPNKEKGETFPAYGIKWMPPAVPEWAQPAFQGDKYRDAITSALDIKSLQVVYEEAMGYAKSFDKKEFAKDVVKLKNTRKQEIEDKINSTVEAQSKSVLNWLNAEIENVIKDAPNASVVNQSKINLTSSIKIKCKDFNLSTDVYMAKLNSSCKKRINQLNSKPAQ
jgi:hypothetical protein